MINKLLVFGSLCLALSSPAFAQNGSRYVVLFKGADVPARFAIEVGALGGSVFYQHPAGIALVDGLDAAAVAAVAARRDVAQVEPDSTFQLDPEVDADAVESVGQVVPASPTDPTTAARYARQWNMRAIFANEAWAAGRLGSAAVTLAIIDTGIDYTYPDLAGLVDLSRSVSFIPEDDALVDTYFPGKHYVTDLYFHGTHVASTAVSNSNIVAGVTTRTTLMGVKVCGVEGGCPFGAVIAGVLHAADNGADVANMSLGGGFSKAGNGRYVGFINRVFNYANNAGMTVVVSAGNEAWDLDHDGNTYATYCAAPNVICVSATGPTSSQGVNGPWANVDAPTDYTNYGNSAISVAAPGGSSAGYVWAACSRTSLVIPACQTGIYIVGATGTSMSAPHVSGLASLLVEDLGRKPGQIRARIRQSADDLGKPGTDPYYGKGRINVGSAVQ